MQSSTSVLKKWRKAVLLFSNLEIKKARNGPFNYDINHEKTTDDETQVLYTIYPRCGHAVNNSPKYPSDISTPEPGRNIFDLLS